MARPVGVEISRFVAWITRPNLSPNAAMTPASEPGRPDERLAAALRRHRVEVGLFRYEPQADRLEGDATWAQLCGLGSGAFSGRLGDWLASLSNADRAHLRAELRIVIEGLGDEVRGSYQVGAGSGARWLSVLARVDAEGGRSWLYGHVRDASEERRRDAEQAASEVRVTELVASVPDPLALHRDGRYVLASPRFARLLGAESPRSLLGQSVFRYLPEDDVERVGEALRELALAEPGTVRVHRHRLLRADGASVPVQVHRVRGSFDGRPVVFESAREIAERARAPVEGTVDPAPGALEVLSASIAHEVNNPLNVVQLAIESLLEDVPEMLARELAGAAPGTPPDPRRDDIVERLRDARAGARRIQEIVRELGARSPRAPGAVAPPPPTHERRRGPRAPGRALAGVLQEPEAGIKVAGALVDYSLSGLRVVPAAELPAGAVPSRVDLVRPATAEVVEAELDLVRELRTAAGRELCFRIRRTGRQGQETLRRWVAADLGLAVPDASAAPAID